MKEDKKLKLEKKLADNILNIIDEFMEDYNVKINKVEYIVDIPDKNDGYEVDFTISTDMR